MSSNSNKEVDEDELCPRCGEGMAKFNEKIPNSDGRIFSMTKYVSQWDLMNHTNTINVIHS